MTILSATPENPNYLNASGYKFWCRKLPNVNFYVQRAGIPPLRLPAVKNPTPFVDMTSQGDHIDFEELELQWIVDEDGKSLIEIFNWLSGVGYPESYDQYKELYDQKPYSGLGLDSEGILIVLDAKKRPNYQYVFRNISPTSLSTSEFELNNMQDVKYIVATATFNYTDYVIESAKYTVDS